jgi:hypothetical protein
MYVDIVFDGPPGPESGRFVEVENAHGRSVDIGEWVRRTDGYWALRFTPDDVRRIANMEPPDAPGFEDGFAPNH